jgi:hypothetical protein
MTLGNYGMMPTGKIPNIHKGPVPMPFFPPQISHEVALQQTRNSKLKVRQLTA